MLHATQKKDIHLFGETCAMAETVDMAEVEAMDLLEPEVPEAMADHFIGARTVMISQVGAVQMVKSVDMAEEEEAAEMMEKTP